MAETFDRAAVLDRLVEHHCTSVNWRDGVAYTYCPSCGEPGCDLAATLAALDAATEDVRELEKALQHAAYRTHKESSACDGCAVVHAALATIAPATGEESAATVAALTQTGGSDAV